MEQLRFRDDNGNQFGEWENKKIEDYLDKKLKIQVPKINLTKENILSVKWHLNGVSLINQAKILDLKSGTTYYYRYANDFIYSKIDIFNGAFGKIPNKYNKFYSSTNLPAFSFDKNKLLIDYFIYHLKSNNRFKRLKKYARGTRNAGILNEEDFLKINYFFPSLPEQQLIGDFLSNCDRYNQLIKEENQLEQSLNNNLLQRLFKQEFRFVDDNGNQFGEWENKKLSDLVLKINSGGTPSTNNNISDEERIIPFLKINDITKQNKYINKTKSKISLNELKNSSSWIVPEKSILYSIAGTIGITAINEIELAINQAILGIIINFNKIELNFLFYNLKQLKNKTKFLIQPGAILNISQQMVKNFIIPTPSLPEQQLIGDFLSNCDKYQSLTAQEVELTKQLNHYLLNRLII